MEYFDKDGNFFVPKRMPVVEAYILRQMETTGKTRARIESDMRAENKADGAPF